MWSSMCHPDRCTISFNHNKPMTFAVLCYPVPLTGKQRLTDVIKLAQDRHNNVRSGINLGSIVSKLISLQMPQPFFILGSWVEPECAGLSPADPMMPESQRQGGKGLS